jgi:hypothetical protein
MNAALWFRTKQSAAGAIKFGPDYARRLRRRQGSRHDIWHLDDVVVKIAGNHRDLTKCCHGNMAADRSSRRCPKTAKSGNIQPSHFNFTVPPSSSITQIEEDPATVSTNCRILAFKCCATFLLIVVKSSGFWVILYRNFLNSALEGSARSRTHEIPFAAAHIPLGTEDQQLTHKY